METVNTMATFKATAKEVWQDMEGAYQTLSVGYVRLALAKPNGAKAEELYGATPKGFQAKCKASSFASQLSLAGRIARLFDEQAKAGSWPKYADVVAFVAKQGSLDKALATLTPARVDSAPKAEPKATEQKAEKATAKVVEGPKVDKFATIVAMVDELNEVDLKTLAMVVADRLAKFEQKATAKA